MEKFLRLKRFNLLMFGLHALQGLIVLIISNDALREITVQYLAFNPTSQLLETTNRNIFSVDIGHLVALFFFLSAIAHLYVSTLGYKNYIKDLKVGINKARWYEYSLSASTMIVLIAMLSGIFDLVSLVSLFSLTAIMNLMGLVMEVHNQTTKKTNWLSYNIGVIAGIIPWVGIVIALWASESVAPGQQVPTFVYWIFVSLFAFFNTFAVNMVLQYKKVGPWSDYLFGERAYIILSLVAKSLLAWQIWGGTLQPA